MGHLLIDFFIKMYGGLMPMVCMSLGVEDTTCM